MEISGQGARSREPFAPFVPAIDAASEPAPFDEQAQARAAEEAARPEPPGAEDVVLATTAQDYCADLSQEARQHFLGAPPSRVPIQHPLARFLPLNAQGKPCLGQYRIVQQASMHTKPISMIEFNMVNLMQGTRVGARVRQPPSTHEVKLRQCVCQRKHYRKPDAALRHGRSDQAHAGL